MEINSINMLSTRAMSSQSPTDNVAASSALKSRRSVLADSEYTGGNQVPQQLHSLTSSNYVKQQIQEIMTIFPPYFPAGSPQRIDLIKGVRGVQEEIQSSPLPTAVKEKLAGQKLTDAATDKEISTALKGIQ